MNSIFFSRLYNIFSEKQWYSKDNNQIVFDNFGKLFDNLNSEQIELILELTERYNWITFRDYNEKIMSVLNKILDEASTSITRMIVFPIVRPEDEPLTKSGNNLIYLLKAQEPYIENNHQIHFDYSELYERLNEKYQSLTNEDCLILVDDYLGSGETVNIALQRIQEIGFKKDQIKILSIVCQKDIYDSLTTCGFEVYADLVLQKGISDFYAPPILEKKIKLMLDIEKLIPGRHFSFGYNQTEALLTMARTPDNTFPIFWHEYKNGGDKFQAPFSRYQLK